MSNQPAMNLEGNNLEPSPALNDEYLKPSTDKQRTISSLTFFVICIGMYVQLLTFMNGAQLYPALSPIMIIFTTILGNVIVWILLTLTGDIGIKHGLPYVVYLRAPFGYAGSQFPGIVRALPAMFFFGVQTYLGSMAIDEIFKVAFGASNFWLILILFSAAQIINCAKGINAMAKFDWVATPILIAVGIYIEYFLIKNYDITWAKIMVPSAGGISLFMATAIAAGPQLSMALTVCDLTRFIKRKESDNFFKLNMGAMVSQFFGLIPAMCMFTIIGMTSGIATGEYNPITVMTVVFKDNPVLLVIVLVAFVLFAQIATNTAQNLMPPGYVMTNLFKGKLKYSTAVVIAGVIGLLMQPWRFLPQITMLLLVVGVLYGPIVGIMISDYFLLRKRKVNIEDLYNTDGQYKYMNNFNPAAFIVFIPGVLSGLVIPDYATFVSMIVGGVCYYLLMKYWIIKKYPQKEIC